MVRSQQAETPSTIPSGLVLVTMLTSDEWRVYSVSTTDAEQQRGFLYDDELLSASTNGTLTDR